MSRDFAQGEREEFRALLVERAMRLTVLVKLGAPGFVLANTLRLVERALVGYDPDGVAAHNATFDREEARRRNGRCIQCGEKRGLEQDELCVSCMARAEEIAKEFDDAGQV